MGSSCKLPKLCMGTTWTAGFPLTADMTFRVQRCSESSTYHCQNCLHSFFVMTCKVEDAGPSLCFSNLKRFFLMPNKRLCSCSLTLYSFFPSYPQGTEWAVYLLLLKVIFCISEGCYCPSSLTKQLQLTPQIFHLWSTLLLECSGLNAVVELNLYFFCREWKIICVTSFKHPDMMPVSMSPLMHLPWQLLISPNPFL